MDQNNNPETFAFVATFYSHNKRWFISSNNSMVYLHRQARAIRAASSLEEIASILSGFQGFVETVE